MSGAYAGIVLAGGRSRRMGRDKALLELQGETLLARTVRRVRAATGDVAIVGRVDLPLGLDGIDAVPDAYPDAGPLGGIVTGLERLTGAGALVVACDLPWLRVELLRLLLELAPGHDAVVPLPAGEEADARPERSADTSAASPKPRDRLDAAPSISPGAARPRPRPRPQPTCAVYSRRCLPIMRARLAAGRYGLRDLLGSLDVRCVEEGELRRVDPDLSSFRNVNTPADWERLRAGATPPDPAPR